eukprot:1190348-Rhodomonas_salina.1
MSAFWHSPPAPQTARPFQHKPRTPTLISGQKNEITRSFLNAGQEFGLETRSRAESKGVGWSTVGAVEIVGHEAV